MDEEDMFKLKNECGILVTLDHPNITHFYGICEEPTKFCIATEFCAGGTVLDFVLEKDYLVEEHARQLMKAMI
jgi:serine/threonine protein kinase